MSDKKKQKSAASKRAARREASEARAAQLAFDRARRKAEQEKRDALVNHALATFKTEDEKFGNWDVDWRLQEVIRRKARKLIDPQFRASLELVSKYSTTPWSLPRKKWLRDPRDWKPKGKSNFTLFKSLVRHLFVKYTMPEFMYSVFFLEDSHLKGLGVSLFLELGAGGSLAREIKKGKFPVPLTKRMCHVFMTSTVNFGFVEAIRHAQVSVFGGDRRLTAAIKETRHLGQTLAAPPVEAFWMTVIQWLCNLPMFDPNQVGPVFDWIAQQKYDNPNFSMKGRTGVSVLRAMEEWHEGLAKARKIGEHTYVPSGIVPWSHQKKVKLPNGAHYLEEHTVTEILTSKELATEGKALRHCVYSYSSYIQRGHTSIWSYKADGRRVLTIEVNNKTRRIMQIRGLCNRSALDSEMAYVKRWAQEAGLSCR